MRTSDKGVSVYLTAAEVRALSDAGGYLSSLIEQAGTVAPDLTSAHEGLHNIHIKALRAQGQAGRRDTMRKALRLADEILAKP